MLKIMEMLASLPRDTMTKACRWACNRIDAMGKMLLNCWKKFEKMPSHTSPESFA
jgi:hypothetical protein